MFPADRVENEARAVAEAALTLAAGGDIALVPAGERWPDGTLRPAIEDLLGAGAIIDALAVADGELSAEAMVMRDAARAADSRRAAVLRRCLSGQELIGRGYAADVELAAAANVSQDEELGTRRIGDSHHLNACGAQESEMSSGDVWLWESDILTFELAEAWGPGTRPGMTVGSGHHRERPLDVARIHSCPAQASPVRHPGLIGAKR